MGFERLGRTPYYALRCCGLHRMQRICWVEHPKRVMLELGCPRYRNISLVSYRLSPTPTLDVIMSKAQKEASLQFPVGTKVRLSIGGPLMVVAGTTDAGRILCQWFDGNHLEGAKFVPETLVLETTDGTTNLPLPNGTVQEEPTASVARRRKSKGR